jgi:UDP-N-acetylglucosamine/UDP-N-acetylgalactosamine 4-epimerase
MPMTHYVEVQESLRRQRRRWLVTGVAGFIGSHLLETLLRLNQSVVGLDNFATGNRRNLADVASRVGSEAFANFRFVEGDIRDREACAEACRDVELVLHQAALGSVPRSMLDPWASHATNVDGFLNVLLAAQAAGARRVVYASSSSVYGDDTSASKQEARLGRPLSPYAATKLINEIYADTLGRTHGIESVGLRYFNVFGPRQDPQGAYAAVIPRWTLQLLTDQPCDVFGDGTASRDFCYVDNVVQANLLAAMAPPAAIAPGVFNVACGGTTSLLQLYEALRTLVAMLEPEAAQRALRHQPARAGDIPHSLADIARASSMLGYAPTCNVAQGLKNTVAWYAAASGVVPASPSTRALESSLEAS